MAQAQNVATSSVAGTNNLSYLNQGQPSQVLYVVSQRDPTVNDRRYKKGTIWINELLNKAWMFVKASSGQATWVILAQGSTSMETLTGDSGGAVSPDGAGNINLVGGTNVTITGTPGSNQLEFDISDTMTLSSLTLNGNLTFEGGTVISESDTGTNDVWQVTADANTNSIVYKLSGTSSSESFKITNSADAVLLQVDADGDVTVPNGFSCGNVTFSGGSTIVETNTGTNDTWTLTADSSTNILRYTLSGNTSSETFEVENLAGTTVFSVDGTGAVAIGNLVGTGVIRGTEIRASGDAGGIASTTGLTNVVETSLSSGTMTINTTTANPGSNDGYIKFYVGTTAQWVPYFTNIAP